MRRRGAIGLTALVSIEDTLELKAGETILIQGGAGAWPASRSRSPSTSGARDHTPRARESRLPAKARRRPGHRLSDQDFAQVVSGCDAVFETVGGDVAKRSFAVVKPAAPVVHRLGDTAPVSPARRTSLRCGESRRAPRASRAHRRAHHDRRGARAEITVYPLAEAAAAHKWIEGATCGKLVFKVR